MWIPNLAATCTCTGHPSELMRPDIGRNASCALDDCLTSRPKGRLWPRELWFSIYSCTCTCICYSIQTYVYTCRAHSGPVYMCSDRLYEITSSILVTTFSSSSSPSPSGVTASPDEPGVVSGSGFTVCRILSASAASSEPAGVGVVDACPLKTAV